MKKLRLTRPVEIVGPDPFGRKAWLRFEPVSAPGWHWRPRREHQLLIPIDYGIAKHRVSPGFLYLEYQGQTLRVVEHIISLRFTGLDGVAVSGSPWPPYHGRPWEAWQAVKSEVEETEESVCWLDPIADTRWEYPPNERGGFVCVRRTGTFLPGLVVGVSINYLGLGDRTQYKSFGSGSLADLEEVFVARAQGWPKWRYHLCRLGSRWGCPLLNSVCWPQTMSSDDALNEFVLHRIGDLLGGFALASHEALVKGNVFSHCAGHRADLELVKKCPFQVETFCKVTYA